MGMLPILGRDRDRDCDCDCVGFMGGVSVGGEIEGYFVGEFVGIWSPLHIFDLFLVFIIGRGTTRIQVMHGITLESTHRSTFISTSLQRV